MDTDTVHIESPRGRGTVSNAAGQELATVEYSITVTRDDFIDRRTGDRIEGVQDIKGSISNVNAELKHGEMYTLTLADGRITQFIINDHETRSIRGVGKFESIEITVSGGIK